MEYPFGLHVELLCSKFLSPFLADYHGTATPRMIQLKDVAWFAKHDWTRTISQWWHRISCHGILHYTSQSEKKTWFSKKLNLDSVHSSTQVKSAGLINSERLVIRTAKAYKRETITCWDVFHGRANIMRLYYGLGNSIKCEHICTPSLSGLVQKNTKLIQNRLRAIWAQ